MAREFIAIFEVEYLLGSCQDEMDAMTKAQALLEELRNDDLDINTATLVDVEEW